MVFGLGAQTLSAVVSVISTGIAGFFYRLLQREVRKRPDLTQSAELLRDEVQVIVGPLPKTIAATQTKIVELQARIEQLEGTMIRLEISHGALEARTESLESK